MGHYALANFRRLFLDASSSRGNILIFGKYKRLKSGKCLLGTGIFKRNIEITRQFHSTAVTLRIEEIGFIESSKSEFNGQGDVANIMTFRDLCTLVISRSIVFRSLLNTRNIALRISFIRHLFLAVLSFYFLLLDFVERLEALQLWKNVRET